jgi:hypothetical protein
VSELVTGALVAGLLNVLGLNVLGLLNVPGLLDVPGLSSVPRPRPVGPVDKLEPRGRIGLPRLFGLFNPVGLPRPDRPGSDVAPVDPADVVGFVNIGVTLGRELADDGAVESEETDEPLDVVGAQLTPGVIVDDGLDGLDGLVALVVGWTEPVVPGLVVVPGLAVVCANAGAVLKAIAHARPAPLRIGIFRILINCSSFDATCERLPCFGDRCRPTLD